MLKSIINMKQITFKWIGSIKNKVKLSLDMIRTTFDVDVKKFK